MADRATGLRTFEGAVALVTGGASGIGAALGRGLAARGALVLLADRDREGAQGEADRIGAKGGRAEAAALDVRDAGAVDGLVVDVLERHGRLDYLFNDAGNGAGGAVQDLGLDDWRGAEPRRRRPPRLVAGGALPERRGALAPRRPRAPRARAPAGAAVTGRAWGATGLDEVVLAPAA